VLLEGRIAGNERPGEGKTLVATLPSSARASRSAAYHVDGHATTSRGATRSGWARCTNRWDSPSRHQHGSDARERRAAYACDITYVTNNEVGFDYLRDNMAWQGRALVQRELYFALVG